ncbi:Dyp-type peroxidase family [Azospirillum oryzae]|uniref:Dyp-type peroxidase family n=1 Tax=Azospirillum oryzae TaxID=286727 RepID=A0A1X7FN51_9PROT|nr:hypothetical protein [Azospirillum oryzae]SMF55542.1 Dyp-type peroxidase family [Azospirillum oryzae]
MAVPADLLTNTIPIDPALPAHREWLSKLQGNVLNGHGRDHTINLFVRLPADVDSARTLLKTLAPMVTSALRQEAERHDFKTSGLPGRLFCNLLLTARGLQALGVDAERLAKFTDLPDDVATKLKATFLSGMAEDAVSDLADPDPGRWLFGGPSNPVDLLVLLADDDVGELGRRGRDVKDRLEAAGCEVAQVVRGSALRTDAGEGIEHFGYVDGRSQPLFLTSDFTGLAADGSIDPATTQEAGGGGLSNWNPFASLSLVLKSDPLVDDEAAFGSLFVFRMLEQNVRGFTIEEQRLADSLGLKGRDRERAGAMAVGRFRDGTPLVMSEFDGVSPPKENDFNYGVDVNAENRPAGRRCPLQAHIRKTNPRGDIRRQFGSPNDDAERSRRIVRRGIPFGSRNRHPNAFQALDDLPSDGVGLLFMCFQASIRAQFAFMQNSWVNANNFVTGNVGIDPLIGQGGSVSHRWQAAYGVDGAEVTHGFGGFVTMLGGDYFFAPSIPFLLNPDAAATPPI